MRVFSKNNRVRILLIITLLAVFPHLMFASTLLVILNTFSYILLSGIILSLIGVLILFFRNRNLKRINDGLINQLKQIRLDKNKLEKYYQGYAAFNAAFSGINEIKDPDLSKVMELENGDILLLRDDLGNLRKFCTYVAKAFSQITDSHCAVTIKLLRYKQEEGTAFVETFVRDYDSKLSRPSPESDRINKIKHKLIDNSDFSYIFDPKRDSELKNRVFFCNNLPCEIGYRNSRLDVEGINWAPDDSIKMTEEEKKRRVTLWPLPYKSTIVVPIVPYSTKKLLSHVKPQGYLCIDSNHINAFDPKGDVEIVKGLADGLYPAMRSIWETYFQHSKE